MAIPIKNPVIRRPAVSAASGYSRSTLYKRIKEGLFTPPISLGGGISGWPSSEVEAINAARIAGKSDEEIKTLVAKLVSSRKCAEAA
jgi:prophage regulatory protein